jgi:hypothetical protein
MGNVTHTYGEVAQLGVLVGVCGMALFGVPANVIVCRTQNSTL